MSEEKVTPAKAEVPSPEKIMELLQRVQALETAKVPEVKAAAAPPEVKIDWSKVSERDVADLNFPIPVIEHELPEYMTIWLKDNSYIAKWCHTTQRRVGTLLAQGYEFIKSEDWDTNYPQILKFDAEGHLTFDDVVAVRIHKSRYYGKIKRERDKSMQIRGVAGYDKVKGIVNNSISNTPGMESAINRGALSFYGEKADSAIEVNL